VSSKNERKPNTLVITGMVPSEADFEEIAREIEHLKRHGIAAVRDELRVVSGEREAHGLLAQTLIGAFETQEQAGFAEGYLAGHTYFKPRWMKVIAPNGADDPLVTLHALLPEAYWKDAERLIGAGKTLLLATVDEVDAFAARELLDEKTRSLETLVLPPEPARNALTALDTLRAVETADSGRRTADLTCLRRRMRHAGASGTKRACGVTSEDPMTNPAEPLDQTD
jgi:hypothetical protein